MLYLLFLLFSYAYFSVLKKYRSMQFGGKFLTFSFPFILYWLLLIGGQYGVGTDYFSYLDLFTSKDIDYFFLKKDYLFGYFVKFCNDIGIYGQGIFFILSLLWVLALLYSIQSIVGSKYIHIYIFVFIVFSGVFHNQMNVVRQYSAVYLLTIGVCALHRNKNIIAVFSFLAMCFTHSSSIALLPIIIIIYFYLSKKENQKLLYSYIIIAIISSFILKIDYITYFVPFFEQYSGYFKSADRIEEASFVNRITKYLYIPLFAYAIHELPKMNLTNIQKRFFITGICGFSFKLALVSLEIIGRMGRFFEILACIPIVFLIIYIRKSCKKIIYILIITYLLLPYLLKVTVFATREYSYSSYFLNLSAY